MRIDRVAAVAAGCLALAPGCGQDSGEPGGGGREPTAGEYRSEATAVCERGAGEVEDIIAAGGSDPDRMAGELRESVNDTAEELWAVEPPDRLSEQHDELRRVMQQLVEVGERGRAGRGSAPQARREYERLSERGDELMTELGLRGCFGSAPG